MECHFYPVLTIDSKQKLEITIKYCDMCDIDYDFLDCNQHRLPVRIIMYISEDDYKLHSDKILL